MKTFIVLMTILSAGNMETHTYRFALPPCQPGQQATVQSEDDYVAVVMRCVRAKDGSGKWIPAPRTDIGKLPTGGSVPQSPKETRNPKVDL